MVSEIRVIREKSGFNGMLEYTHNGLRVGDIKIRTGAPNQLDQSEWLRGKSGCPVGDYFLWNKKGYIQQYNDLDATGKEIGRFYPVSTYQHDHNTIWSTDKSKKREAIGLHDENGITGCLPLGSTEIFTDRGWVKDSEITLSDRVAQLFDGNNIIFDEPIEIINAPYKGKIVSIKASNGLQMDLTPNHRIAYKTGADICKVSYVEAQNFDITQAVKIPANGYYECPNTSNISTPNEARLFVAFLADGHSDNWQTVFHFRKERKIKRIKELLERLGINYKVSIAPDETTYIKIPKLSYSKDVEKGFAFKLNREIREVILDELKHWDGSFRWDAKGAKTTTISTVNATQADFYEELAVITGHRCLRSEVDDKRNESWNTLHSLSIGKLRTYSLGGKGRDGTYTTTIEQNDFDGNVFCLRTRTSNFLVKHNKRIFFTGNSAGCIVVIDNAVWRVLCTHLDDTPEGHITLRTRWK